MMRKAAIASAAVASVAAATLTMSVGVASATPGDWANAPGFTESVSSGHPAGTLIDQQEIKTPSSVKVKARTYILTYEDGTGQITKETVIIPDRPYDGEVRPVLVNIPATDSLNPEQAPSRGFEDGTASVDELSHQWITRGGIVVIPDSYGDQNPTYAGLLNGTRIRNGVRAFQAYSGQENPWVTAGFSGGGLDSARVAEDTTTYVPGYQGSYISGTPADMPQVVADSDGQVQSGLIMASAMPGVFRSLPDDDKAMLDSKIRPSVKEAFQALQLGGAGSDFATFLGVVGIQPDWLFRSGSFDDPAVQAVFDEASLGQHTPTKPVAVAGNLSDPWMVWDHNGSKLAETYQAGGADVTVMTSDVQGFPGHRDLDSKQQIDWLDKQLPASSKLQSPEPTPAANPVQSTVMQAAGTVAQAAYGAVVEAASQVAPAVSQAIDPIVEPALDIADAVIENPPVLPSLPPMSQVTVPAPAPVVPPAPSPAPAPEDDTISQVADATVQAAPAAAPVVQQVEDAVRSVPAIADAINGIKLPALP